MRRRSLVQLISAVVLLAGSLTLVASQSGREGFKGFWGAKFRGERHRKMPRPRPPRPSTQALERLHHWNSIAVDASGLDHTPVAEGEDRNFGEQLGPGRASRAVAIVHLAIYEAVNAIDGGHESFTGLDRAPKNASIDAAIAQAAYDTLVEVFPSQSAIMRGHMKDELAALPRYGLAQGLLIGRKAAQRRAEARRSRRFCASPSRSSASTSSRAPSRGNGGRIRSAKCRSPWARIGARSSRSFWNLRRNSASRRRPPSIARNTPSHSKRSSVSAGMAPPERRPSVRPIRRRRESIGPTTARRACARHHGSTTRSS